MRKVIVATLALTPMLLHAQANSPAQPQTTAPSTLQSKLVEPNALHASESNPGAAASTTTLRVSTGVTAPKLIHTVDLEASPDYAAQSVIKDKTAIVAMTVDEAGKPSDLKIVQSISPAMDKNVLTAVSQYRFKPGTLDGAATSVPLNLEVTVHASAR
ncbi:MAG: TonB family protein [Edaphobacter sp.]